jgi:galactitol-specific phosphotransferase system IIC component
MNGPVRNALGFLLIAAAIGFPLSLTDGGSGPAATVGWLVMIVCGFLAVVMLLVEAFRPGRD